MVQLSDYSVTVLVNNKVVPEKEGYVALCDGDNYELKLENNSNASCNAKIVIDGKDQGTFRMFRKGILILERPANESKLFTFVLVKEHGAASGHTAGDVTNGLISVTFTPEKQKQRDKESGFLFGSARGFGTSPFGAVPATSSGPNPDTPCFGAAQNSPTFSFGSKPVHENIEDETSCGGKADYEEGGTCLTGSSTQKFVKAAEIDLDEDNAKTIHLRLVGKPKLSDEDIVPLRSCEVSATPIPPPVFSSKGENSKAFVFDLIKECSVDVEIHKIHYNSLK